MRIEFPGVAWIALLVFLAGWLEQYVEAPWVPIAIAVAGGIVKALEIWSRRVQARILARPPVFWRWLFG